MRSKQEGKVHDHVICAAVQLTDMMATKTGSLNIEEHKKIQTEKEDKTQQQDSIPCISLAMQGVWLGVALVATRGGEPRLTWATGGGRTVSRMGGW